MSSQAFELLSPLSGHTVAIERVPDPVFSKKMVGDGIAVDPTGQILTSPCDGTVVQLHSSCHAVTVRSAHGFDILMHIGLDTVTLKGQGFTPLIKEGDKVKAGDTLIKFDAELLAEKARSLMSMVLIADSDKPVTLQFHHGTVKNGDVLMTVTAESGAAASSANSSNDSCCMSEAIIIGNPQGLHARPAAVLAGMAKRFRSNLQIRRGNEAANCKSVVAIMGLQVMHGEAIQISASGEDAQEAIKALSEAISSGLGETVSTSAVQAPLQTVAPLASQTPPPPEVEEEGVLRGVRRHHHAGARLAGDPS